MAEEQVVKVQVVLDDQATAQIIQLRKTMDDASQAAGTAGQRVSEGVTEIDKAIANLGQSVLGVGRTFQDLGRVIGPVPLAIGLVGFEIVRSIGAMKEWAQAGTEMGNAARRIGMDPGQFTAITDQMRAMGTNSKDAINDLISFNRAYTEIMTSPEKRAEILKLAPGHAQEMARFLLEYAHTNDQLTQMNAVRHAATFVRQNELNETHNERMAAFREEQVLQAFNAQFLEKYTKDLTQADLAHIQHLRELNTKQDDLHTALSKEAVTRDALSRELHGMVAGPETELVQFATRIEAEILQRMEKATSLIQLIAGYAHGADTGEGPQAFPNLPNWWRRFLFTDLLTGQMDTGQGAPIIHEWAQRARGSLADQLGLGSLGGPATGGGATSIARFSGGDEDDIRQTEEQTTSLSENSDEVRQLNANIDLMLDRAETGGGGLGGLGGGPGGGPGGAGGGYGGGGGGGYGYGGGGGSGTPGGVTEATIPAPPAPTGPTGAPLGGVTGAQPFGINVSADKFEQVTGLPAAFMNVSPGSRAAAAAISTGRAGVGLGGEFTGQRTQAGAWPTVRAPGGGAGVPAAATGATGPLPVVPGGTSTIHDKFDLVDPNALYQSYVTKFRGSKLDGLVPTDGAHFGVTKGTPEEWARLAVATSMQESGLHSHSLDDHGRPAGLNQFQASDLRNYGVKGDVYDPNASVDALVNAWSRFIPGTKSISSPSGGGAYFGSLRLRNAGGHADVDKHLSWAAGIAAANAAAPAAGPALAAAPGTGGVTVSPVLGLPGQPGGGLTNMVANGAIKPDVLAKAAAIAKSGNEGAVRQFLHDNNVPADDRDCAEFVTAVVKASGGTPPKGFTYGAAYRDYGAGVEGGLAAGQPGDILSATKRTYGGGVGTPLPPGAVGGGHAAMIGPGGVDREHGTFDLIQADPLKEVPNAPIKGYWSDFYALRRGTNVASKPNGSDVGSGTADAGKQPGTPSWPDFPAADPRDTLANINKLHGGLPTSSPGADDLLRGSRYETGDADADRSTIDQNAAAAQARARARIQLKIAHKNAAADTTVKTDGELFKGSSMERSNAPPPPKEAPTKFKAGGLEFA